MANDIDKKILTQKKDLLQKEEKNKDKEKQKDISWILTQGIFLTMKEDLKKLKQGLTLEEIKLEVPSSKLLTKTEVKKLAERPEEEERLAKQVGEKAEEQAKEKTEPSLAEPEPGPAFVKALAARKEKEAIEQIRRKALIEEERRRAEEEAPEKIIKEQREGIEEEKEKEAEKEVEEEKKQKLEEIEKEKIKKPDEKELKLEKEEIERKLQTLSKRIRPFEQRKEKNLRQKEDIEKSLREVIEEEQKIVNEEKSIEEEEKKATTPEETHKTEQKRWRVESRRKEKEKERWTVEKMVQETEAEKADITSSLQKLEARDRELKTRLKEIEVLIQIGIKRDKEVIVAEEKEEVSRIVEVEPSKKPHRGVMEEEKEIEEKEKEERIAEEIRRRARSQAIEAKEKRRISEIQKIAREEAERTGEPTGPLSKEKILKRLTEVSSEEQKEREEFLERVSGRKKMPPTVKDKELRKEIVFRPIIKRTASEKVLIRTLIVLSVVGFAAVVYFLLHVFVFAPPETAPSQEQPFPSSPLIEEEPVIEEEPEEEEKKEIEILIPVDSTSIFEFSSSSQVSTLLSHALTEELEKGKFRQIIFKNSETEQSLNLQEFLDIVGIKISQDILSSIAENSTLFIYNTSKNGLRFGFIVKIKEPDALNQALSAWEAEAENDTEDFFRILGKDGPALLSYFRKGSYQEKSFKCQAFNRQDLGICYSIFKDYFVFTSSWEQMEKTLELLILKELQQSWHQDKSAVEILAELSEEHKIGQLFIIGVNGKTITAQTKELIKAVNPGGILLLSKNIENAEQLKKFTEDLQKASLENYDIPLLIAIDEEGKPLSRIDFIETKTPQSEIENTEQSYQVGLERGKELKELGININLSPVLEIAQPGDFIFERSFQKNSEETGNLAKSLILGQQAAGILSAVKHFPGYQGISYNPEEKLAILEEVPDISQFKKAMEAKPSLVMVSTVVYSEIDSNVPVVFSSPGIQFLRNILGFQGIVISDDLAQNVLLNTFSLEEVIKLPIQAGVDILIFSGWKAPVNKSLVDILINSLEKEEISEDEINKSLLKIIELKKRIFP